MIEYQIYLGCNDRYLHKQLYSNILIKQRIKEALNNVYNIDSFTMQRVEGVYKLESEATFLITILDSQNIDSKIKGVSRYLKVYFNQESVLVTKKQIEIL